MMDMYNHHDDKDPYDGEMTKLLTSSMGRTIWLANKKDMPVPRPFSTCNWEPLLVDTSNFNGSYNLMAHIVFWR